MILTASPLRVSLFGGGTDHPEYFLEHGGAVLGMAIDRYVYVGVKRMPPGQINAEGKPLRYRVQYSKVEDRQAAGDIDHPAVRAALRYLIMMGYDEPLEIHCISDLPGRSGLGGSSAFVVGILKALQAYYRLPSDGPVELAREAIAFERHVVQEAVGFQDQIFASLGGINYIRFGVESEVQRVELPAKRLSELEASLVLVYTGAMRDDHAMAAKQVEAIPRNAKLLRMMADQASIGLETLLSNGPLWQLASELNGAWEMKSELYSEISNPAIDALYARGLNAGAFGGKLLGAGGGGYMLFYVLPERRERFEELIGAPCIGFKVAHEGSCVVVGQP